ncbi:OmpA family protein [Longibacter salinarum]|nr:OmpA family protein [Longibacter salinarum]
MPYLPYHGISGSWLTPFLVCVCLIATIEPLHAQTNQSTPSAQDVDVLNLSSGAIVLSHSGQYDEEWAALLLLDDTVEHGWSAAEGASFPHEILIELQQPTALDSIAFDNSTAEEADYPGISARHVEVWVSTDGPDTGFSKAIVREAAQGARSVFSFPESTPARWLKLVIKSNWGHESYTELMELEAYGETSGNADSRSTISGVYDTNYDLMRIEQRGTQIYGCYDYRGGTLTGSIDDNVAQFEWRHKGRDEIGTAIMVLSRSGNQLNGLWYEDGQYQGLWTGSPAEGGEQPACTIPTDGNIAQSLSTSGRAIVYGIRFDVDSAQLRAKSEETLRQVRSVLNDQPDLRLAIEGHTDNTGSTSYNAELSKDRAQSVVQWLTERGIDADRLEARGYGEKQPVSTNSTSQGRALNRRVELVRQ